MVKEDAIKTYGDIIEKVTEEKYIRRQINWDKDLSYLLEKCGDNIGDSCLIAPGLIASAAQSYFADIIRLKEFHLCERVKDEKILAYSVYWLLRNSPIQITNNNDYPEHRYHINEDILSLWLIRKISLLIEKRIAPKIQIDLFREKFDDSEFVIEFYQTLRYNFIYRQYTQQTILLMIEGFVTAAEFILQVT
jgi:hypothetical protein